VHRTAPGIEYSPRLPVVQAYLLGTLDHNTVQSLQHRLAYDVAGDPSAAAVILCDHPPAITIGREGSWAHVRVSPEQLHARRLPVRWVARGGGAVLHAPGQVACYPILPLDRMGLTPAEYLAGLCGVVGDLLAGFGVSADVGLGPTTVRVAGRRIAHFGVAVRNWVASYGFVLNVNPDLELFRVIDSDGDPVPVTSLQRECPTRVRVPTVRQRLLDLLALRFGFGRVSVFHSHPTFLPRTPLHAFPARNR
jgi:lipoyl(octanoyl) transferase